MLYTAGLTSLKSSTWTAGSGGLQLQLQSSQPDSLDCVWEGDDDKREKRGRGEMHQESAWKHCS